MGARKPNPGMWPPRSPPARGCRGFSFVSRFLGAPGGEGTRVENACLSPDPPSTSSHLWFEVPVSHVTSFSVHRAHFPFRKSGKEGS